MSGNGLRRAFLLARYFCPLNFYYRNSISDGIAFTVMLRLLSLIQHCHGVIFQGKLTRPKVIDQQVILTEAIVSGALPGHQHGSRAKKDPVQLLLLL